MSDVQNNIDEGKIADLRRAEAEDLAHILASRYQIPYLDLSRLSINTDALRLVPEDLARKAGLAAFSIKGILLQIAVVSPRNEHVTPILTDLESRGYKPTIYVASQTSIDRAWSYYAEVSNSSKTSAGLIDIASDELEEIVTRIHVVDDIKREVAEIINGTKNYGVSKLLEVILAGGVSLGSSDIHLEPEDESVRARYRLDGVLHDVEHISHATYKLILSRVKLISALKLNLQKEAQDGRFTIKIGGLEIEVRTSVIPGSYGESLVLRILDPRTLNTNLETLGIEPHMLELFEREIRKPNGMMLVTGPTGSGKTTTLYAFLKQVNSPESKIITIENPIEYHLKGISQTQVNEDGEYTFAEGLRSALRQDPDIIMVGEIRDSETAKIAVNAALTGHLVFSTLHTNTAAGAIPRLIDLEINPNVLSSALSTTIAQRLVRKLCQTCKTSRTPDQGEQTIIERTLRGLPISYKSKIPTNILVWEAKGCSECNNTGFKGRVGIYEVIVMTPEIEAIAQKNPSEHEIRTAAKEQGYLTMEEDGMLKVLSGTTSLQELSRVIEFSLAAP